MRVKISVIVPVYNAELYLNRCVDSILNQTFDDYEIVLVDDGSTDSSRIICDTYAANHEHIRVVHQDNAGHAAARNKGFLESKGKYVCFIDADDIIHPQMLEFMFKSIVDFDVPLAMCCNLSGDEIPKEFYYTQAYNPRKVDITENVLIDYFAHYENTYYWCICTKLMLRELYQHNPLPLNMAHDDSMVVYRWLVEAKQVVELNNKMYFYYNNPNSVMRSSFNEKKADYLKALESQIYFYNKIKYKRMMKSVLLSYLGTSRIYEEKVRKELHNDIFANDIKHGRIKIRISNLFCITNPKINAALNCLKYDGAYGLVKKLKKRYISD